VAASDRALILGAEPVSHVLLVAAVRADLTPDEHASHWQLANRTSRLVALAVRTHAPVTLGLLGKTVRADQVNKRRALLQI